MDGSCKERKETISEIADHVEQMNKKLAGATIEFKMALRKELQYPDTNGLYSAYRRLWDALKWFEQHSLENTDPDCREDADSISRWLERLQNDSREVQYMTHALQEMLYEASDELPLRDGARSVTEAAEVYAERIREYGKTIATLAAQLTYSTGDDTPPDVVGFLNG